MKSLRVPLTPLNKAVVSANKGERGMKKERINIVRSRYESPEGRPKTNIPVYISPAKSAPPLQKKAEDSGSIPTLTRAAARGDGGSRPWRN